MHAYIIGTQEDLSQQERRRCSELLNDLNSSDEEGLDDRYRCSGAGILEFSPEKAGMDVTPANFKFERDKAEKRHSGALSSIAGEGLNQRFQTLLTFT
jgi:hypothetical protein